MNISLRLIVTLCLLSSFFEVVPLAPLWAKDDPAQKEEPEDTPQPQKQEAADIDWVDVESTGILSSAKDGAFEKTLWQGQNRSDIEKYIKALPDRIALRSVLNLQRRLLLSQTDASLIKNDTQPEQGHDLLIARIQKLIDMGLYDDAWSLYTQKAENPYDVSISQMGMVLLVVRNDLATACLEEKVFSNRFPHDAFFSVLDNACAPILGAPAAPQFKDNAALQSVYNDPAYGVFAKSFENLVSMDALTRALVFANGKIRYDGLTPEILSKTPSSLVALYVMDKAMPDSARTMVEKEMSRRGLSWHTESLAKTDLYKRAKDLSKDPEDQWPILESALTEISNPADLSPFTDWIAVSEPKTVLSTKTIINVMKALLASQKPLPPFWAQQAQAITPENPIVYIYLQAFTSLTPTPGLAIKDEKLAQALKALKDQDRQQVLGIITTLDKENKILNNPAIVYEKHSVLTAGNNYVMPTEEINKLLDMALEKKQIGITILALLNSLAAAPDNMYSETVTKALDSMLSVGLIEDAKLIGAETVTSVLNKY